MKRGEKMKLPHIFQRTLCTVCAAAAALFTLPQDSVFTVTTVSAADAAAPSEQVGLVGNLFCISGEETADHAALQWSDTVSATHYTLCRSTNSTTGFEPIYEGSGTSYEDDDLTVGTAYYYQLTASGSKGDYASRVLSLTPSALPQGLQTYDNQKGSSLVYQTSGTKVGNTYYNYALKTHAGTKDIYLAETSSSDGVHFGNERNVADSSQNSALSSCKIESVHITYMEKTGQISVWAHWEKPDGYSDGKALVITGTPGGKFTVHHVYNPLGIQVRDMAVFVDDDGTGYLIAAANVEGQGANATLYIFRMTPDYSDVTEVVVKLFENQYREFPNLIKVDGWYYLFTSQAAGWYPSSGAYSVTKDLAKGWSGLRPIGNTSTFSSQSGWIVDLQGKNYLMHAYRWLRASETSGTTLCPLYFDNGFAFYDYYPYFKYNTATGDLFPVQTGELLSQDKQAASSLAAKPANNPQLAFDGSYQSSFAAIGDYKKWPFYLQVDLGCVCSLSNIQTSWYICKGSEGYYTYTVEGSTDGINWTKLLDHTDTSKEIVAKTYGFNSDMLSGNARYVRLNVKNATLQNNPTNNWYTPTVYECKIFGKETAAPKMPAAAACYDFENGSTADSSGNSIPLTLKGNAKRTEDAQKGGILYLDGSSETYAAMPDGFLDGCRDYTVSLDVKNETEGDFFTFAAGKNDQKYVFFRVGNEVFRFAVTTDTWRGESVLELNNDGTDWHNYTISVNGATVRLYRDGKFIAENPALAASVADMGSGLTLYFGKSYYEADNFFRGGMDNIRIWKTALNAEEIASLFSNAETKLRGDVNADGAVNIADAVVMQRWLLQDRMQVNDAKAGDLDDNGIWNARDFALLKALLLR